MIVPFRRNLKLNMNGPDALALKRALRRKGFGTGIAFGKLGKHFGYIAVRNLKKWQEKYAEPQTGIYDHASHRKMVDCGGFDRYGAWLMAQVPLPDVSGPVRAAITATALFGVAHRESIHYTEGPNRMSGVRGKVRPPQIPPWEDCSSFATWCYWVAGTRDPNGLGYNGYGYTGTLVKNGRTIAIAKPGDLVFYGGSVDVPAHVAIAVSATKVVSNGSESGPLLLNIDYRGDRHSIRTYL